MECGEVESSVARAVGHVVARPGEKKLAHALVIWRARRAQQGTIAIQSRVDANACVDEGEGEGEDEM